MLIATSPRLSSDQEKSKSTEEAYPVLCISSQCNSGIFVGKGGDTDIEDHSRPMPTSQSTYSYTTDGTATKQPKEHPNNQRTITGQHPVHCNSAKPTIIQSNTHHYTKQSTESQGEEFFHCVQHAEGPAEEFDNSLQTAVKTDEFSNILQTVAVEEEKLHSSIQLAAIQTVPGSSKHTSTAQSEHLSNHLQIATVKSDSLCNSSKHAPMQPEEPYTPLHTTTVQSERPLKSLQTGTTQSGEPFTSLHTSTVQSETHFKSLQTESDGLYSAIQMPAGLSVKLLDCSQTESVDSERPCNSLWTATDQLEGLNRPPQTSTVQSERLSDFPYSTPPQSLCNSKEAEPVQPGEFYNLGQLPYVRMDGLYHTGQAEPNHSDVLYQLTQDTTVQAECHHTMETTEDQVDSTVHSGQRPSTQCAEPNYIKQASTVHSEEIYLSRTCDSHWSDSVTANKVAVEGDLNG